MSDTSRSAYDLPADEWPEGKVVVTKARGRNKVCKYHTTRCRCFPSSPMFMRLETIQAWDEQYDDEQWAECTICAGGDETNSTGNWSEYAIGRKNSRGGLRND